MNRSLAAIAAALLAGAPLPAQETNPPPLAEALPAITNAASATPNLLPLDTQAEAWRAEALARSNAFIVAEGSIQDGDIAHMGRDVVIAGSVNGDAAVVNGDLFVLGKLNGDASVVRGNLTVLGEITGDAAVVMGDIRNAGRISGNSAVVLGQSVTSGAATNAGPATTVGIPQFPLLRDFKPPQWHAFWTHPLLLAWRGSLLVFWLAATLIIAVIAQPNVRAAADTLAAGPVPAFGVGILWTVVFWFLILTGVASLMILIGLPIIILALVAAFILNAFGLAAVFAAVGRRLGAGPGGNIIAAVAIGAVALGILRFVPILGSLSWFLIDQIAPGIALITFFAAIRPALAAPLAPPPTV